MKKNFRAKIFLIGLAVFCLLCKSAHADSMSGSPQSLLGLSNKWTAVQNFNAGQNWNVSSFNAAGLSTYHVVAFPSWASRVVIHLVNFRQTGQGSIILYGYGTTSITSGYSGNGYYYNGSAFAWSASGSGYFANFPTEQVTFNASFVFKRIVGNNWSMTGFVMPTTANNMGGLYNSYLVSSTALTGIEIFTSAYIVSAGYIYASYR